MSGFTYKSLSRHFSTADTDDSNGKNSGTAYAMKCLGDDHAAKYFATMAAHASFTARAEM